MQKRSVRDFLNIILNGTALGVVAGLIPNAVLSTLFKYLGKHFAANVFTTLSQAMYLLQFSIPVLVGMIVGQMLKFKPLESAVLGATVLAASGSLTFNANLKAYTGVPMGDLFNVMLITAIGAIAISLVKDKFGSVTIIFLPITGGLVAALGLVTLPYMKSLTILFKNANYVGAGAATLGLVAAAAVLSIGTFRAKSKGASIAIILGAIKLMMPNCARRPQLFLPILTTAAITGLSGYFLGIQGTHESAGFGIIGLIGPTKAYEMNPGSLVQISLAFFVIPFTVAFLADRLYSDVLKLYKPEVYRPENY